MSESSYKLRKRINELKDENSKLRSRAYALEGVMLNIFDSLAGLKENQYLPPLVLLKLVRPLLKR